VLSRLFADADAVEQGDEEGGESGGQDHDPDVPGVEFMNQFRSKFTDMF
jgi:hypothetical protein